MKSYKIIVEGYVQGVYYRKTIQQKALQKGFNGYVKNLSDGNVEVGVMLNDSQYDEFIKLLKTGSSLSKVDELYIEQINEKFQGFEIRY